MTRMFFSAAFKTHKPPDTFKAAQAVKPVYNKPAASSLVTCVGFLATLTIII